MKRLADCRAMLLAAGTAAIAAGAGTFSAQSVDILGIVEFEGGAVIPKGQIEIYINDPAIRDNARHPAPKTRVESDGGSRTIEFSLSLPTGSSASARVQIIGRLERSDGWLLARGSAKFETDSPVYIILYTVMY